MKRHWSQAELIEEWTLLPDELTLIKKIMPPNRLGCAVMLKYFQYELRYPRRKEDIPKVVVTYLAEQLSTTSSIDHYDLDSSTAEKHRAKIRAFLGFDKPNTVIIDALTDWLIKETLPRGYYTMLLNQRVYDWLRDHKLEPPTEQQLDRYIHCATKQFEDKLMCDISSKLSTATKASLIELLQPSSHATHKQYNLETIKLHKIKADPGPAKVDSILMEIAKLNRIEQLSLPDNLFVNISPKILDRYKNRVIGEPPRELLRHGLEKRHALLAIFCYARKREIIDNLVDLIIQIIHKINAKAEKRVVKEFLNEIRKINGKTNILYRIAQASIVHPQGVIKDIIYPIADEQTLRDIVREYKATAGDYILQVHTITRSSYSNHYRRLLVPVLNALKLSTNNAQTNPVFQAINLVKKYAGSTLVYFPKEPQFWIRNSITG